MDLFLLGNQYLSYYQNASKCKLFSDNLLRQPVMVQLRKDNSSAFRVVGQLNGADQLMRQALFLGTYPGLTKAMLDYEIEMLKEKLVASEA